MFIETEKLNGLWVVVHNLLGFFLRMRPPF